METQSYKALHESYMKNNNGTTIPEIFITIVPVYFTAFLSINLVAVINAITIPGQLLLEFLLIILSLILNITVLNFKIWEIASTLVFITVTAAAKQLYKKTHYSPFVQIPNRRPQYIVMVRSIINLITAVCILAVDFRCFPRKLAKSETFGFGLMDVGVGLYVYSNGIVATELKQNNRLSMAKIYSIFLSSLPLILLGIARFVVTTEIDYQQHVSEYGVHWNFFITLAITKILGTLIFGIVTNPLHSKYIAVVVLVMHEMILQLGLADYVTSDGVRRDTFVNANREGLVSIPGYVSLFFASTYVGALLRTGDDLVTINPRQLLKKTIKIGLLAALSWKVLYVCQDMFGVSRRLANMGYVVWIISIGTTMTCLFIFLEVFYYFISFEKPKKQTTKDHPDLDANEYCPIILSAINYNGLGFFLGANLLTGLVNLMFQTLMIDSAASILILTTYMFVLCSIIVFLYLNKIKLKI